MESARHKIAIIAGALEGEVRNKDIFAILQELEGIALQLGQDQRSELFHNKLRGFNRMWGDEFSPQASVLTPILDDLFRMHGFPEERAKIR